ncbi:MAG: hypothetical protein Q8W51_00885 [Candidatus Palauibacterales bacterium]|nr:hypothetical protein [Candidatus Palauibacterales bacterium]MDP2584830.1 hypothetical protein [Candidatus Palauibacterales bacterium]
MRRYFRPLWALVIASGALYLSGCYTYVPLQGVPDRVQQGTALKIHFGRPVDVRMGEIGANDVVELDAEMVGAEGDSLAVSVFQTTSRSGYQQQVGGRTARVPADAVAGIEIRKFSAIKTILAGGLVVGAALAAAAVLSSGGGGTTGGQPPPAGK